jgi:hypothetical protein
MCFNLQAKRSLGPAPITLDRFFYQDCLPAAVMAAAGASLVGQLSFMTVRALGEPLLHQVVMGAPPIASRS